MPKKIIRNFPREYPYSPWPLIQVLPEDRLYVPRAESRFARRLRLATASSDLLAFDLGLASGKGALFGLFAFAVIFSFVTLYGRGFCWWVGWHWAIGIGALLSLFILIGFDLTVLIVAIVALVISFSAMLTRPGILLLFILGGIVLRAILELLPRRT